MTFSVRQTKTKSNLHLHLRLILFQYCGARKRPHETKHLGMCLYMYEIRIL